MLVTRTLELGPHIEESVVDTRRKVAEVDNRLGCAGEAGGGLDCNSRLMTSCFVSRCSDAAWLRSLATRNVRNGRLTL